MIVLGADTHKRSHTIAAVCAVTGELWGEKTVPVGARGFAALLVWARGLQRERVWALEDCRHVSGSRERFLIERGERVVRVATKLMADARRGAPGRGKSDSIDAIAVARAAVREGLDELPCAHLDGPELDLRLLVDHRERLVRQRVALNNTLRGICTTSGPSSSRGWPRWTDRRSARRRRRRSLLPAVRSGLSRPLWCRRRRGLRAPPRFSTDSEAPTVGGRRGPGGAAKVLAQRRCGAEPGAGGDLLNRKIGPLEQAAGFEHALGVQPAKRSGPGLGDEPASKGPLADVGTACERPDVERLGEVLERPEANLRQ
jgi:hypothetical protein